MSSSHRGMRLNSRFVMNSFSGGVMQFLTLVVCVVAVSVAGCGGSSEEPRYELSGEVTWDGKPIPNGTITFQSLTATDGTSDGFATISEGKFETSNGGRGHFGGLHQITITGVVVNDPGNPDLGTKSLFEPYVVEMELPRQTATQDFTVNK